MKIALVLLAALIGVAISGPVSELRLIQFSPTETKWMTIEQVEAIAADNQFMDITNDPYPQPLSAKQRAFYSTLAYPTAPRYATYVNAAISRISISGMTTFLTTLSNFFTRYYTSTTGVQSSEWVLAQAQQVINSNPNFPGQVSVSQFVHSGYPQRSVIARIEGANPSAGIIVLGAHQDSIVSGGGTQRSPGVDDDGSGSTTIFEIFRILVESGFVPKAASAIEFQWYAAEEVGLRGSADIALNYKNQGVNVTAMAQFDMTGHLSSSRRIGFVTDYTDPALNAFMRLVADEYLAIGWMNRVCGYACSDHASYYRQGFPAAFPFEDQSNSAIHTTNDDLSRISFSNIAEFVKLGLGYVVELGEP